MRTWRGPSALHPPRPSVLVWLTVIVFIVSLILYPRAWTLGEFGLGAYLSVVWTLPTALSVMAVIGSVLARRSLAGSARLTPTTLCDDLLVVQVPTIGRTDVMPALRRVVRSMEETIPACFSQWRVDVVAEERSEARDELEALRSDHVRVLFVPSGYATPNHTQAKARANCWVDRLRRQEGESRHDVWVLHMDDDTSVGPDTVRHIARFINANAFGDYRSKVLAQGVLTYPRQFSSSGLVWLADAVRPGSDLSAFRLWTGLGRPLLGAHGELLLVRADVESAIGWDYGRDLSITEDANFALLFATRHPGRSAWFPARSYGSSPESFKDLVTQRRRWARGLLHVARNPAVPLRNRLLLRYALTSWVVGPLQHVLVVLGVAAALGMRYTAPVQQWILGAWALNMGVGLWMYVDGLRANCHASGGRVLARYALGLLLIPFFTLVEGWAGLRGFLAYIRDRIGWGRSELFEVIAKTHEVPTTSGGTHA
ncbi:glycosyltransferase family 2 protein [Monashia sp. NPDC004114]